MTFIIVDVGVQSCQHVIIQRQPGFLCGLQIPRVLALGVVVLVLGNVDLVRQIDTFADGLQVALIHVEPGNTLETKRKRKKEDKMRNRQS